MKQKVYMLSLDNNIIFEVFTTFPKDGLVTWVAICNVALFHLRNIMETLEDKEETNQEETVQDLEIPNEAIWDGRK